MPKYRCVVTGGSDKETSRRTTAEILQKSYTIDAGSLAEAVSTARRKFEHAHGPQPGETVICELESLVAIREASESDLRDPHHRLWLERAAVRDGAAIEEIAGAKRSNGAWPT